MGSTPDYLKYNVKQKKIKNGFARLVLGGDPTNRKSRIDLLSRPDSQGYSRFIGQKKFKSKKSAKAFYDQL